MNSLHSAADIGNLSEVQNLINAGADINAESYDGRTALHYSVSFIDIVKLLVYAGADVHVRNNDGSTALHEMALHGFPDGVKLMIVAGSNVNSKKINGWTPLHCSALSDCLGNMEVLIAAGADINAKNENGQTALHISAHRKHEDMVKLLIAAGSDASEEDKFGNNALDESSSCGTYEALIRYTLLYQNNSKLKQKLEHSGKVLHKIYYQKLIECEEQVKEMKETLLGGSCTSFFKFITETGENKLAFYMSEENFGLKNRSKRMSYLKKFSKYREDIIAQFDRGSERANLLCKSHQLMMRYFCSRLPPEIIRKISECMPNDDMEGFLMMNDISK